MKALLVNQYFPPDRSATATMAQAATNALREAGHHVTVIAGRPSYDTIDRRQWRPLELSHDEGIRVLRVGSSAADRSRMVARLMNYGTYAGLATPVAMAQRVDVVIGMTDPPFTPMFAGAVARLRRSPFVYWIQDIHPDFAVAAGILRDSALVERWRLLHQRTLRAADEVIVLGDDMANRVIGAGVDRSKVHVVPNGTSAATNVERSSTANLAHQTRKNYEFVIVSGGNIGYAGAWDAIVDAAAQLDANRFGVVFIGDGSARPHIEQRARLLANVHVKGRLPADEYAAVQRAADLQIVSVRRGIEGLIVPTRLYDALAAGTPVLAVADEASDVVRIVRRHDCGYVCDPDDPASIAATIRWADSHRDDLAAKGHHARDAAVQYRREDMMRCLVAICEQAAHR